MQANHAYWLLAAVRLGAALSPGYLHPDEHFQSPEVSASLLGYCAGVPWELQSAQTPFRSLLPPLFMSYLPMRTVAGAKAALGFDAPTGQEFLISVRLWMFCLSLIMDAVLFRLARPAGKAGQWGTLLAASSCWAWVCFAPRPFSNTAETWIAAALLAVPAALDSRQTPVGWTTAAAAGAAIGAATGLGMFVRFTAAFLAIPVACVVLCHILWRRVPLPCCRVSPDCPPPPLPTPWAAGAAFVGSGALACGACMAACGVLDTWLFTGQLPGSLQHLVLAPYHSAMYNADPANTASHGQHPHWQHAVANAPAAFTLLAAGAYWQVGQWCCARKPPPMAWSATASSSAAMLGVFVGALSLAPHAELRFLLPLILPLALLQWRSAVSVEAVPGSKGPGIATPRLLWTAVNAAAVVFMCCLHQAGVGRALSAIPPPTSPRLVVTYGMYMPPQFLAPVAYHPAWCSHPRPEWVSHSPLFAPVLGAAAPSSSRLVDVHDSTEDLVCTLRDVGRAACCEGVQPVAPWAAAVQPQAPWPSPPTSVSVVAPARLASVVLGAATRDEHLGGLQCGQAQVPQHLCACSRASMTLMGATVTPLHFTSESPPRVRNITGVVDGVTGLAQHMQVVTLHFTVAPAQSLQHTAGASVEVVVG